MPTRRRPEPGPWAREFEVATSECTLSGLLAEPAGGGEPRALIIALHGMQMHAGFFDCRTVPGLSLMEAASAAGYRVWAVDRPGTRASIDLAGERRQMRPQADILLEALDRVVADGPIGAGVFVVGHSYGGKAAIAMVGRGGDRPFIGLDVNGVGLEFAGGLDPVTGKMIPLIVEGDHRNPSWGPPSLYPDGAISKGAVPTALSHPTPIWETPFWPEELDEFGPHVRVPVRITFGEYERWWKHDPDDLARLRAKFPNAAHVATHVLPGAGHNLGLGLAAAQHHRNVLAFVDECIAATNRGVPSADLR